MEKIINTVKKYKIIPLVIALIFNTIAYNGTRVITTSKYHYDITSPIDNLIPIIPATIIIYLGCYVYWLINYVLGAGQEDDEAYKFLSADLFAKLICMVIFIAFPTTNTRPVLEDNGFFTEALKMLYQIDAADNLFPSIHCLTSWFCLIAVRKNPNVKSVYKIISVIITVAICVSTLTTKQHVIVDVAGGIALAEFSYLIVDKIGFTRIYQRSMKYIEQRISR
ncbi:MAG: phosphatase PAP2 family protein [Agathobacter sp.]|nr:phosphatase PAP2 family protein [Agathobacter sp.]